MRTLTIRRVKSEDLPSIHRIESVSFASDAYPPLYLKLLSELFRDFFIVAELDGKVVGYAVARIEHGLGHVVSIAVLPEHRRLGVGRALMQSLLEALLRRGIQKAILEVRESNIAAQNLYRKMGFRAVNRVDGYYGDGEAAIVMAKELVG